MASVLTLFLEWVASWMTVAGDMKAKAVKREFLKHSDATSGKPKVVGVVVSPLSNF